MGFGPCRTGTHFFPTGLLAPLGGNPFLGLLRKVRYAGPSTLPQYPARSRAAL